MHAALPRLRCHPLKDLAGPVAVLEFDCPLIHFVSAVTVPVSCRYQDYQASDIPTAEHDGVKVRIMAGQYEGTPGPIVMRNPGLLMDVTVSKGATFTQEVHLSCATQACLWT